VIQIEFTSHLQRHLDAPTIELEAATLPAALTQVFQTRPELRGYILDDQGSIRQHVAIFVDGRLIRDRDHWDIPLKPDSQIYVMQALSGG